MLDGLPIYLWMHDENYTIVYANHAFKEKFGQDQNLTCYQCLMGEKNVCSCCLFKNPLKNVQPEMCKVCKRKNSGYDIDIYHIPIIDKKGQKFILTSNLHIDDLDIQSKNILPKTRHNTSK